MSFGSRHIITCDKIVSKEAVLQSISIDLATLESIQTKALTVSRPNPSILVTDTISANTLIIGVASLSGEFFTDSQSGDIVIRSQNSTKRILLGAGVSSDIIISSSGGISMADLNATSAIFSGAVTMNSSLQVNTISFITINSSNTGPHLVFSNTEITKSILFSSNTGSSMVASIKNSNDLVAGTLAGDLLLFSENRVYIDGSNIVLGRNNVNVNIFGNISIMTSNLINITNTSNGNQLRFSGASNISKLVSFQNTGAGESQIGIIGVNSDILPITFSNDLLLYSSSRVLIVGGISGVTIGRNTENVDLIGEIISEQSNEHRIFSNFLDINAEIFVEGTLNVTEDNQLSVGNNSLFNSTIGTPGFTGASVGDSILKSLESLYMGTDTGQTHLRGVQVFANNVRLDTLGLHYMARGGGSPWPNSEDTTYKPGTLIAQSGSIFLTFNVSDGSFTNNTGSSVLVEFQYTAVRGSNAFGLSAFFIRTTSDARRWARSDVGSLDWATGAATVIIPVNESIALWGFQTSGAGSDFFNESSVSYTLRVL